VTPPRHRPRDHAEQTHRRQQQRADREGAGQSRADCLWAERLIDEVLHSPRIADCNPRIQTMHGRLNLGQQRMRFARCAHDEEQRPDAEVVGSNQKLRPPVGMKIIEPGLIDNADDRE